MKVEIAKHARMSERGSSLLRLIQNNETPVLDLLVRESVQNSLDASRKEEGHVNVEFNVTDFDSENVNRHFEGITDSLNERFTKGTYKLLEIKDSNTFGLTGPLHYKYVKNNDFGNLLKLVYEISMPQQQEGAGGSWGLGKTIYFRLGIGLVLYYSRVKTGEDTYQSRLAACLVEDESKPEALLKPESDQPQRGIAWWGQPAEEESTMPITDDHEIESILESFGVTPYGEKETGTTIVIPYISEKELLEETMSAEDGEQRVNPVWWTQSIKDYLKVSVQRWYAPRLMNPDYKYGDWLRVKINRQGITKEEMLPVFQAVQGLYNLSVADYENQDKQTVSGAEVKGKVVRLRKTFKNTTVAGKVSYAKFTREQLKMTAPENQPDPFIQLFNSGGEYTAVPPIVAFTRKPGMIVGYETAGHWTDDIPKTLPGEYIIAVFAANSDNTLEAENTGSDITLEEYIRKGEKADHTSWNDWNFDGFRKSIVARIQQQVRFSIKEAYEEKKEESSGSRSIGLSRTLAEMFLPPDGFGKKPTIPSGNVKNPPVAGARGANPSLEIGSSSYTDGRLKTSFTLYTGKKSDTVRLQLRVMAESGDIPADQWESASLFGKRFPFQMTECFVSDIKSNSKSCPDIQGEFTVNTQDEIEHEGVFVRRLYSPEYSVCYGVEIQMPESKGYTLTGELSFQKESSDLKAGINVISAGSEIL